MCTKWFADGDVHKYFNPYDSPYDSFIAFMNVLNDIIYRIKEHNKESTEHYVISEKPGSFMEKGRKEKAKNIAASQD